MSDDVSTDGTTGPADAADEVATADDPIKAAGAVVWRGDPAAPHVAIVHRPRYDDWSLPKGKIKGGEFAPVAAMREVREETGADATLGRRLGQVEYEVTHPAAKRRGHKVVDWWSARATENGAGNGAENATDGAGFTPNDEVDEVRWLPVAEARVALTNDVERDILDEFAAVPAPSPAVIVVRHAKAGSRSDWDGHDDDRPLTPAGHEQATHLAEFLALFGVDRVVSAPRVRCVETVAPLAASLGVEIEEDDLFSEEGYWPAPEKGLARFVEIAGSDGVTVIASQGGVIPSIIESLVGDAAARGGSVPSKKASVWVLCEHGGSLVSADYYSPPKVATREQPGDGADPAVVD